MLPSVVTAVLAVVVLYGLFFLPSRKATDPFPADPERSLHERFDRYVELRMDDDQKTLYTMTDPEQRERFTETAFLDYYGRGVLKPLSLKWEGVSIDKQARTALVKIRLEAELVPENMPAQFKANFQRPQDPADLRSSTEYFLGWVWRDGEWYYRIDLEAIGGPPDATTARIPKSF